MNTNKTAYLTQGAIIAALYVVLCEVFAPISFKNIQFRVAEGLTILPFFTSSAILGLFIGCFIGNILGGAILLDIVCGSLATLFGAIGTYMIGKYIRNTIGASVKSMASSHNSHNRIRDSLLKFTLPLPPIIANTIIVPLVLYYGYGINIPIPLQMLTVGLGEIGGCGVIGMTLLFALETCGKKIFYVRQNK